MKKVIFFPFLFVVFFGFSSSYSQTKDSVTIAKKDSVYLLKLIDSSEVTALSIDSASNFSYFLIRRDSSKARVAKSYVTKITKIERPKEDIKSYKAKNTKEIKEIKLSKKYLDKHKSDTLLPVRTELELGANIGTPSGINALLGISSRYIVGHISGMNLGTIKGIQLDIGYQIYITSKSYFVAGMVFGNSKLSQTEQLTREQNIKNFDYTYVGGLLTYSYKAFYAQFGLG